MKGRMEAIVYWLMVAVVVAMVGAIIWLCLLMADSPIMVGH